MALLMRLHYFEPVSSYGISRPAAFDSDARAWWEIVT
jgi:hypothetical protein